MASQSRRRFATLFALSSLVAGPSFAGCSSGSNPQPPSQVFTLGDEAGTDATTAAEAGSDATSQGTADAGLDSSVSDAALPPADVAVDAPPFDAAACVADSGCWSCPPLQSDAATFLNHCTSAQCVPFDNLTRLPGYDGGLPPLH
jgi:hypothetical protein